MRMGVDEGLQDLEDSGLTVGRGQSESEPSSCLRETYSSTSHAY